MQRSFLTITSNRMIAPSVYEMKMEGNTSAVSNAGQFVELSLEGFFLRRPISVCDYDENTLTILYKVVGKGTEKMSEMKEGEKLKLIADQIQEATGVRVHLKTVSEERQKVQTADLSDIMNQVHTDVNWRN